jgi:hypothetical protein
VGVITATGGKKEEGVGDEFDIENRAFSTEY